MAATTGYSYGDLSNREDLWDSIKDVDVIENYVSSHAGTVSVSNKIHSWVIDPIAVTSSQAGTAEGADTTYAATNPTLLFNTTQIIEKGIQVTKTNQNSDHAAFTDKYAREKLKKMKEWKNQLEFSMVAGSLASGTGTAARTMKGIAGFASTIKTQYSTVSLSSDMFNLMLRTGWDNGAKFDTILAGAALKSRISSWTNGNTRNVAAQDAVTVGRVDVYDSDFGRVTINLHQYVNSAGAGLNLIGYMEDMVHVGVMDEVHHENRPNTGYFTVGSVVGEYTAQVDNEKAVGYFFGLA